MKTVDKGNSSASAQWMRPFNQSGHYVAIHDSVFDVIMRKCPPNAFKVLMLVIRNTEGWRREEDAISYSQIRRATGIASDSTVHDAIGWLLDEGMILATKSPRDGVTQTTRYQINRQYQVRVDTTEIVDRRSTGTVEGGGTKTVETITSKDNQTTTTSAREEDVTEPKELESDDELLNCVMVLGTVKNFPRDAIANALKLSEYRREFPKADPEEVVKDFAAWCDEHSKTKPTRLRLRNFFKQAHKSALGGHLHAVRDPEPATLRSKEIT